MELKPGYKQTEVGVIPEDWEALSLNDACIKIQDGTHFSPKIGGSQYKYITSKNIGKGSLSLNNVYMISEEEHRKIYKRCDVKLGDVLLTKDGINTGNTAINHLNEEFSLLSSVALLRVDTNNHNNLYLMYQILSGQGQARITNMISGNAITRLTLDKIKKLSFPFPSTKHEQRLIAEKIHSIDSLITSLEKLIEKKKLIKQGVMQELLTGKRRLPGFSGEWETKRLGKISSLSSGGTPLVAENRFYNGNIPWVTITDISKSGKYITETERTLSEDGLNHSSAVMFPKGTILFAMYASIGKVTIASMDTSCNQAILGIESHSVEPEFLYYYLSYREKYYGSLGQQGTQNNLNKDIVQNFIVPVPDPLEQKQLIDLLSTMDYEIHAITIQISKTRLLKQAMMQELLTGRIRLI